MTQQASRQRESTTDCALSTDEQKQKLHTAKALYEARLYKVFALCGKGVFCSDLRQARNDSKQKAKSVTFLGVFLTSSKLAVAGAEKSVLSTRLAGSLRVLFTEK